MTKKRSADRKVLRDQVKRISDPSIARLAKDAGISDPCVQRSLLSVRRVAGRVYDTVRQSMRAYLEQLLTNSLYYADHKWKKSLTLEDVKDAVDYMKNNA